MHRFRLTQRVVWTLGVFGFGLVLMACTESLPPLPNDGAVLDGAADLATHDGQQSDQAVGDSSVTDGPIAKDGSLSDGPAGSEWSWVGDVRVSDGIVAHDLPRPTNDLTPAHDMGMLKAKCLQLDADYVKAVAKAKSCSSWLPVVHCTKKVKAKLICPCQPAETFVETLSKQISRLAKQFATMGCAKLFACPKPPCSSPKSAGCTSAGSIGMGTCTDKFN